LRNQLVTVRQTSEQHFLWSRIPMDLWIRCGGAVVFDQDPLLSSRWSVDCSLWDKLCSSADEGIVRLLSTVIYRLLVELKPFLLKDSSLEIGPGCLAIKTQQFLIARSIDSMLRSGRFGSKKYEQYETC
uniref:Mab-21 domain-containing protein n=1 Tax=Gongylonema pulchrum TaxID=637853 RepID=A0A183D269_9BILA